MNGAGAVFSEIDKNNLAARKQKNYEKYGKSPLALDWNKGKQNVRFDVLTSAFNVEGKSAVDIGCGFGDLRLYLHELGGGGYFGVDISSEFIDEAKRLYADDDFARFKNIDFLHDEFNYSADLFFASGTFNYKFEHTNNYDFIKSCMTKAYKLANEGLAFDFLSDKVDWKYDHAWYSNPSVILEMAYELSRNVILRNDYMPFEFSVTIFKDDTFEVDDTLFNLYKLKQKRRALK